MASPTPQKVGDMAKTGIDNYRGPIEFNNSGPAHSADEELLEDRRQPTLREMLDIQLEALGKLRGLLEELGDRLDPLLLPSPTPSEKMLGEDSPEQSLLAYSIESNTNQVRLATRSVVDLLQRIQL